MPETCIIGAGISGLAHAWRLQQEGHEVTVLEASSTIGGAIRSVRKGGYLCEEGPNSIQLNSPELEAFFQSIPGLEDEIIEAKPEARKRFIVRNGKLQTVPMDPLSALITPLWSSRGKLRALKEPFIKPSQPDTEESVADFVRRRLGNELYQYAINPLIGGIYAGNPEELSLRHAFPKLHEMEQAHGSLIRGALAKQRATKRAPTPPFNKRIISFKDGVATLPRSIAKALGEHVRTSVSIHSIQQSGSKWKLSWDQGDHKIKLFDQLIVTVPAHALSSLPFPGLFQAQLKTLAQIEYPPVSVLSLGYNRKQITHPIDGFGALVPECENRSILGVLFPESVFENRAPRGQMLLTLFIGGTRSPKLATANTQTLQATVQPDLKALLGINEAPDFVHHTHWPKAIPQYTLGYGKILETIKLIENQHRGLRLLGNYRNGISLTNCIESTLTP